MPSRIAYGRRLGSAYSSYAQNSSGCISSMSTPHYRELSLPRCDPSIGGALCDGQSIVALPVAAPPSHNKTPHAVDNNVDTIYAHCQCGSSMLGAFLLLFLLFFFLSLWLVFNYLLFEHCATLFKQKERRCDLY